LATEVDEDKRTFVHMHKGGEGSQKGYEEKRKRGQQCNARGPQK